MRICAAQTKPFKGDIAGNVETHLKLIELAVAERVEAIFFPELSITGYEPELAARLATDAADPRFDVFQAIADRERIAIGIGAPTRVRDGVAISTILFQPNRARQTYSKKHLHASETGFFASGRNHAVVMDGAPAVALAICYELSVPEHAEEAFRQGAKIYAASVVESVGGVEKAAARLASIAARYRMTVLMANCVGHTGIYDGGGKSSVWNERGTLAGELDAAHEGIVVYDTVSGAARAKTVQTARASI